MEDDDRERERAGRVTTERAGRGTTDRAGEGRGETGGGIGRRDFLHVGLLGVGAASCAGVAPVVGAPRPRPVRPTRGGAACEPLQPADVTAITPDKPETWNEPWVWRPSDWPGQQLDLNVVENQNPGIAVGLGNPGSVLFSYGGDTPGPTIRMRGDETLFVKLRNLLGQDYGQSFVGPFPRRPNVPAGQSNPFEEAAEKKATALGNLREDFCLGEHANGVHAVRVTNLHTHGLHVSPSRNPNGTHSDNVILRVLSQADFRSREQAGAEAACRFLRDPEELYFLRDDEVAGEASYEFRLGDVQRAKRAAENQRRARERLAPLPAQPHPAGTFWYHPHAHGATHNQVASGMAGFLIVEGDIEEAINRVLVEWKDGNPRPDPSIKSGPYDYRERLMFMQRVLNLSQDKDARKQETELQQGMTALVNGGSTPTVIRMRPGAIERWRVLNGSVDGRGYKRIMVVKGQYTVQAVEREVETAQGLKTLTSSQTFEVDEQGHLTNLSGDPGCPFTLSELETLEGRKQDLYQLSIDGVTLVKQENGEVRYYIKDLSRQGTDASGNPTPNPLWSYDPRCEEVLGEEIHDSRPLVSEGADLICRLMNVWRSPENVRNCFVHPNEYYMGPANRTDLFFQAPQLTSDSRTGEVRNPDNSTRTVSYDVYTVFARTALVHADTPQFVAQAKVDNQPPPAPSPEDVILAYVLVEAPSEEEREQEGLRPIPPSVMKGLMGELEKALPPVQEYLLPIDDGELRATVEEAGARSDVREGDYRTRRILYSGWGHPSMPLVSTQSTPSGDPRTAQAFARFIENDPMVDVDGGQERKHENLIYTKWPADGEPEHYVLMPPDIRTMAISFNNARIEEERRNAPHPEDPPYLHPELPRKFDPTDPYRARMLEDTAEEWTLYNLTSALWGDTRTDANPPTPYGGQYVAYPISRAEGQSRYLADRTFQLVSRGIDHPFHVHQNPFWVTSIEIPDETGELVNILDEPRWMDAMWIPRDRGRVVLRMRFPDFVGAYVHHCHILLHEDNGMMHVIEATPFPAESNYSPQQTLDVGANAPRPSREEAYTLNSTFYDPDRDTGQLYPGFEVTPPRLSG